MTDTTQKYHHDYPYRLRLQHPDFAELRIERRGRWFRIDAAELPEESEVVVLTAPSTTRVRATLAALRAGRRLSVVAPEPLATWIAGQGAVDLVGPVVDGLTVRFIPYTAPRVGVPMAHMARATIAGARPLAALRRVAEQRRLPAGGPHAVEITFEDGARLLHLDLALHAATPSAWVDEVLAAHGSPEWLVVGLPWGETDAVARLAPRFGAKRVLVTELVNGERRELGLPTELVTPLRDRLHAGGVEAHVFATQTSYRFE